MAKPTPSPTSGPLPVNPDGDFNFDPGAHGATAFGLPMVYWGQTPGGYDPVRDSLRAGARSRGDHLRSVDESTAAFYAEFSDEERTAWAKRMFAAGFTSDPNDIEGAFKMWATAVDRASLMWQTTQKPITPWQAMDMMEGANAGLARKPKTTTSTSTSYDIPTAEDANALVAAVFRQAFGRAPNDSELSRYRSIITSKAKANPRLTRTTQTTDLNGNVTSSSTSSGGYSNTAAEYDALQRAREDPEYGAYQAATTYFNALVGAIGAPG